MSDRRSHWFPPNPKMWVWPPQAHMLLEDFNNHVVPYRRDPEPYKLSAEGVPHHLVDRSLTLGEHRRRLQGFLQAVATRLLTHHEVWLEVTFSDEHWDGGPFKVFEVDGVTRTAAGNLVQKLPSLDKLPDWYQINGDWKQEVELDPDRMIQVTLPEAYPSRVLMQVIRDLAEVPPNVIPPWAMSQLTGQRREGPLFDPSEAFRTERLSIAQAARPIGWDARESLMGPSRQMNDFYLNWRKLRFLHFRSSMRGCAEDALRQVLALAGGRCGFTASVTAHGIYTPDEITGFIRKFEAGKLVFSDLNDIVFEQANYRCSKQRRVV